MTRILSSEKNGLPPPEYQADNCVVHVEKKVPPAASGFRTTFGCMSLHSTDRIRFLRFPADHLARIDATIQRSWARGIKEKQPYDDSYDFKLHGTPWCMTTWSGDHKPDSRRLCIALLSELYSMGWVVKAAVDVSKKAFDKDSLLLRYQDPPPAPCSWMCVSFDKFDLLRVIDAPSELVVDLVEALGERVKSHEGSDNITKIQFRGNPWYADGTATVKMRTILLILMDVLEQHGFSLYASINIDMDLSGTQSTSDADTFFCNRPLTWTPGNPIYHD